MNASSQDVLSQPEQTPKAVDPILLGAVDAAELLLSYAMENEKNVDEEFTKIIATIVRIRSKCTLTNCALNETDESEFWSAYNKLCIATAPVSRESLDATTDKPRPSWWRKKKFSSISSDAVYYYQFSTIIFIFLLLFCQSYWVFLSTIIKDINFLEQRHTEVVQKISEADTLFYKTRGDITNPKPIPGSDSKVEVKTDSNDNVANNPEIARYSRIKLQYEKEEVFNELANKKNFLSQVDFVGKFIYSLAAKPVEKKEYENLMPVDSEANPEEIFKTGPITLKILSLYILPILYGLVGACAYILRTIAREIKARTFTNALRIHLQLRLVLGALAGFSIAWFAGGAGEASVANVAPLALAFLAGYSVELLFSAMDSLVEAFTRRGTEQGNVVVK